MQNIDNIKALENNEKKWVTKMRVRNWTDIEIYKQIEYFYSI